MDRTILPLATNCPTHLHSRPRLLPPHRLRNLLVHPIPPLAQRPPPLPRTLRPIPTLPKIQRQRPHLRLRLLHRTPPTPRPRRRHPVLHHPRLPQPLLPLLRRQTTR